MTSLVTFIAEALIVASLMMFAPLVAIGSLVVFIVLL